MEDVKKSRYFYFVCNNIEEAWRLCDPKGDNNDKLIPDYEDCSDEEGEE